MTTDRLRRAAVALGALGLVSAAGCTATGDPGAAGTPAGTSPVDAAPLVPATGAYLGLYYGDGTRAATDAAIGRTPQLHLTYVGWDDEWATSDAVRDDARRGQVSLVNWEPAGADVTGIAAGDYDDMLTARAEQAGELAQPVFLDLAAEMNSDAAWGGHDPARYVAAYRHVHDVFARHDHGNVVWVWAPNSTDSPDAPGALDYYPGDAYVDWTGIDGYNWGTSEDGFTWQTFAEVFAPVYRQLHALGKPVLIAETASAEEGGSKADWIAGIVPALRSEFPDVRALVWFDVAKERDWRIRSSAASLAAFQDLAADPYLQATAP